MTDPVSQNAAFGGDSLENRLDTAFQKQEQEGLKLAAHLRAVAMLSVTVWVFLLLGQAAWFYLPITLLFVVSGYLHHAMSRWGFRSDAHALLFFLVEVALVTIALLAPNPLLGAGLLEWPEQMAFRFGNFNYYYMMIAIFALGSYSARAMLFAGAACTFAWEGGARLDLDISRHPL